MIQILGIDAIQIVKSINGKMIVECVIRIAKLALDLMNINAWLAMINLTCSIQVTDA